MALRRSNANDEDGEDDDDDGEDDGGNEEDDDDDDDGDGNERGDQGPVGRDARRAGRRAVASVAQPMSFRDVEDSVQTFSGEGKQNIRKWLEEFEETSEVCRWTEPQKIIYAKKLLRGSAKLFVTYEQCAKTWKRLKKSLISEFGEVVNSKSRIIAYKEKERRIVSRIYVPRVRNCESRRYRVGSKDSLYYRWNTGRCI